MSVRRAGEAGRTAPARGLGPWAVSAFVAVVTTVTLFVVGMAGSAAARAPAGGPAPPVVPISPAGAVGQFNLSSSSYAIARRFVLAEPVTIDRWYYAVNGEGADCVPGREGYGSGDGGTMYGRIVEVDPTTGLPTDRVLGSEQVTGCEAYERAREEFGLGQQHQVQYVRFPPVPLQAGRMYAFVLSNVAADPGDGGDATVGDHMSPNLNIADLEDMGPNGRNTLDPTAPGAVYGLDPRETTMWSEDSGRTWSFGDEVGWYGEDDGRGGMWPGGYRIAGGANVAQGWTYMNWPDEGPASVTYTADADQVLVEAGGASTDDDVGVITVENLETGVSATTPELGSGLVRGPLDQGVPIEAGQQYAVSTDGSVDTGSAEYWDRVFDFRTTQSVEYVSACPDCELADDRPMLYAAAVPSPGVAAGGGSEFPVAVLIAAAGAIAAAAALAYRATVLRRR